MKVLPVLILLAASPITLQQVRELSRQSTQALLAELDRQRAQEQVVISRAAILPQLAVLGDVSRTWASESSRLFGSRFITGSDGGFVVTPPIVVPNPPSTSDNFRFEAQLQQLLFDGGKWWNQIAQSGAQQEAAAGQAIEQQLIGELEGVRRFYVLFGAQRTLEVLQETVKRSQEQLDRANALYEAGRLNKSDAIQAQVNLGTDRIAAVKQRASIVSAQTDLVVWIRHPGAEDVVAENPGTIDTPPSGALPLEEATKIGHRQRPLIRALDSQVRAADLSIAVAKSGFWPRVSAFGSYVRSGNTVEPVFTDFTLNNTLSAGLSLRWDLFSGFSTTGQTDQARYNRFTAELNLSEAQRQLDADIRRNVRSVEVQLEASKIALEIRNTSAAGLTLARERFRAGLANTLEVRDAQLKLTQAELSLLQSRIDLEMAREGLFRTIGGYVEGGRR
jgi:outer membrane protein TolC